MKLVMNVILIVLGVAVGFIIASVVGAGVSMNLVTVLLLAIFGAIVGFVVEWIIDESIRKNRELRRQLEERQSTPAGAQIGEASRQSDETIPVSGPLAEVLRQHKDELHQLREQVEAKDTQVETIRREFETYCQTHPDDLTQIKGIGAVYQRKLRDIGFHSFKELAAADPAQIRRMLGIKNWQRVDIESWIQQARDWAEHS